MVRYIHSIIDAEISKTDFDIKMENFLKFRGKGRRLSNEEKKEIYNQISKGVPIKDLKELYQISISTINRIVKHIGSYKQTEQIQLNPAIHPIRNRKIWSVVASYAQETNQPFTCNDIKEHMMEAYSVWLDTNIIRKILKEKLNYSFKRCSPRPLLLDHKLTNVKKSLFAVKLIKLINNSTVLINVDESVISNSTKINYSWGPKGKPLNLSTTKIRGSISLFAAIASCGISVTGIRKGTVKSNTFVEYIKHLLSVWKRL